METTTQSTTTKQNADTPSMRSIRALAALMAVAETVRELGEVPAGTLYATLMGKMSHATFESMLSALVGSGLVERRPSHLLVWVGPRGSQANQ